MTLIVINGKGEATMKLGFNGATTMKAGLIEDAEASSKAGFDYLELRDNKLEELLKTKSLEEIDHSFQELHIQPIAVNSLEKATLRDETGFEEILKRADVLCQYASTLHCPILIAVPSFLESSRPTKKEIKENAQMVLKKLEELSRSYGVKIAFEFLGFADASVNTLSFCNEIVEELNNDRIGMIIDTFHFYLSDEPLSVIEKINPEKIFLVHIADAENLPKTQLKDANREVPGSGVIPLKDITQKLKDIGYKGAYSIELFNPTYWEWEPEQVAKVCYQKMRELLS